MNSLQRCDEWHLLRKGKVTASEIYVLLGNHKEDMTEEELAKFKEENPKSKVRTKEVPFSTGSYTYMDGKVAEMFMPDNAYLEYIEECKFDTKAMQWGTLFEDKARETYCNITHKEIMDAPFIPYEGYERFAGGSPDGLNIKENAIIEVKCPFNPAIHLRHFLYETQEDLKNDNLQYYAQVQYNMLVSEDYFGHKCEYCDFISYDPRTSVSKQLKVLRVLPDEELQNLLTERTKLAVQYMKEQVDKINNAKSIM